MGKRTQEASFYSMIQCTHKLFGSGTILHDTKYNWKNVYENVTGDQDQGQNEVFIFNIYLTYCLNCFNMNVLVKHFKLMQTTTKMRKQTIMASFHSVLIVIVDEAPYMCHVLIKLLQEHISCMYLLRTLCMTSLKYKGSFGYMRTPMFEERIQIKMMTLRYYQGRLMICR